MPDLANLTPDQAAVLSAAVSSSAGDTVARLAGLNATSLPIIVAVEGDSRVAYGKWGQSSSWRGFTQWLQIYSNQRLKFPGALNTAVSGNGTTQILARLPASITAAKAAGASAMFLVMGINDRIAGLPYATTMSNVAAAVALVQQAGLICILFVDTSQGTATIATRLTVAQQAIQKRTRDGYRQMHNPRGDVYVVDVSAAFDDPLATSNFSLDTMVSDGTHDQPLGSYMRAMAALPTVNVLWKPVPFVGFTDNSQPYNATDNPGGCLTANPMVDGIGGVINASAPHATGQIATGWNFGANTAGSVLTAALSKVTKADGTVWQQAAISGTTGSGVTLTNYPLGVARMWFYQTISLANAPVGSKVQVSGQFEYDGGNANVSSIVMGSEASLTSATQYNELGYRGNPVPNAIRMPDGPWSFPLCANEPMVIPATASVHLLRIGIVVESPNATVAMTFRFRATGAQIVP